ncbi:MAG: hypothetical protein V4489_07950 [Chlamydiota bacterium]
MIYANNHYQYFNEYFICNVKDVIAWGSGAITDLFFTKTIPPMSVPDSLGKIRLNADYQELKSSWQSLSLVSNRKEESQKLRDEYQNLTWKHGQLVDIQHDKLFGDLGSYSGISGLFMPGVAIIATHLKEKKGLDGLFVCATRKALCTKMEEIIDDPKDQRCALIVGTSTDDKDFPLHKMTVCIEKKDGVLHIALLDSFGSDSFSSGIIHEILGVCEKTSRTPEIFLSVDSRERAGYGCGVFALQDAVSFLQDEQFFQYIDFGWTKTYGDRQIEVIDTLPPGLMIGAQTGSGIKAYKKKEGQKVFDQAIPGRKKTLDEYLQKNSLLVDGKTQNHYITKKTFQYQQFIVAALKDLMTEEVKNIIHTTLLT